MQEVRTGIRASLASAANRPALDGRVIKVKLAGEVQRFRIGLNGAVCEAPWSGSNVSFLLHTDRKFQGCARIWKAKSLT